MRDIRHLLLLSLSIALLASSACRKPAPPPPTEVVLFSAADVPLDPSHTAWQGALEFTAALIPQDLVEPRQLTPSTTAVRVRALTNGVDAAFRLEWTDPTANDLPGAARFSDACAVQLPSKIEATVPAPQMGEAGGAVEIVYWNAAWQAVVAGRSDSIKELYPNAAIDHYPFEAPSLQQSPASQQAMTTRYAPARAVGNPVAGPRTTAVQDLIAEGPGTITSAPATASRGQGVRTAAGWAVVIVRPLPKGLAANAPAQVAFAVWEGAHEEVGARKMRTDWIPLALRGNP
jgi:DMSO reductase family type II enzyme heme b subunit